MAKPVYLVAMFEGIEAEHAPIVERIIRAMANAVPCEVLISKATSEDVDLVYGLAAATGAITPGAFDTITTRNRQLWKDARRQAKRARADL